MQPIRDAFLPPPLSRDPRNFEEVSSLAGNRYQQARLSPQLVSRVMKSLALGGAPALAQLPAGRIEEVWGATVDTFLDPESVERQALQPFLEAGCGLSPQGLDAGLEAVLKGVHKDQARELFLRAESAVEGDTSPLLVILAGNLPALAVQPLLPALAVGRPMLMKSSSSEPFFAAAFSSALAAREPLLGHALAALTWQGGDDSLEGPAFSGSGKIVAYGEAETLTDLEHRSQRPIISHGPRMSLAVLGPGSTTQGLAAGLARDIALFDQRGCLSIQAIFMTDPPHELAEELTKALEDTARLWPPGKASINELAAVRQVRTEAQMRGLENRFLSHRAGTVIIEPELDLYPSPGLRTVRLHHLPDLADLPKILASWRNRLQGVALAGDIDREIKESLSRLGVSRFAAPGKLQKPGATWRNGGLDPLEMVR